METHPSQSSPEELRAEWQRRERKWRRYMYVAWCLIGVMAIADFVLSKWYLGRIKVETLINVELTDSWIGGVLSFLTVFVALWGRYKYRRCPSCDKLYFSNAKMPRVCSCGFEFPESKKLS